MARNDQATSRTGRRTLLKLAGAASVATIGFSGSVGARTSGDEDEKRGCEDEGQESEEVTVPEGAGLVTVESDESVDATVERIEEAIESQDGLSLIASVDHAENAASVDEQLPPTRLLIFGNPALGTQLMQCSRSTGIDLPQKLLVREDENGQVNVTYNDPEYLAERHGLDDQDETLSTIAGALETLATGEQ